MEFGPDPEKFYRVILARPQTPENIGLAARAMKNTGFADLTIVQEHPLPPQARITAVHAEDLLEGARICASVGEAVSDLDVVFAAVARHRKNFPALDLGQALERMKNLPPGSRVGFLFGNERTGLESSELLHSNFRFTLPQSSYQPSYNLASAVLLTLFHVSHRTGDRGLFVPVDRPLPRREQEDCFRLILEKLEEKRFFHAGNRRHVEERIHDLFGRFVLTQADRDFLVAIFGKL
jgi:TrmH family RNA methyltransferase